MHSCLPSHLAMKGPTAMQMLSFTPFGLLRGIRAKCTICTQASATLLVQGCEQDARWGFSLWGGRVLSGNMM